VSRSSCLVWILTRFESCSVLQCVAVCGSVLCAAVHPASAHVSILTMSQSCSVLQCVAVCCSV